MSTAGAVRLKVELAAHGLRLDQSARDLVPAAGAGARSLDLVLHDAVRVVVPIAQPLAVASPFLLIAERGQLFLVRDGGDPAPAEPVEVRLVPEPKFYARRTERGIPMRQIATQHGSHILVTLGGACGFSAAGSPCRFCLEGARTKAAIEAVSVSDVLEVVRAASSERAASYVCFNTGVFDAEDGGIEFLVPYIRAVRRHFDTLIAAQIHPPRIDRWIDHTYAAGVDAVSYNLEIFDAEVLDRQCIGRARFIGRGRYLEALAHAARVFPRGTVWSDLVVGVEPVASTLAGIDALAELGVVPVVSLFRPTGEGAVSGVTSIDTVGSVLAHLHRALPHQGIAAGWIRDLASGITPLEARGFVGDAGRLATAAHSLVRSRLGALAARNLARFRRRLRVRDLSESSDSTHG